MAAQETQSPGKAKATMKTTVRRSKHSAQSAKVADSNITTFSSDLLTPEEERELLTSFWDVKCELVRVLVRHYPTELHRFVRRSNRGRWPSSSASTVPRNAAT